MHHFGRNPSASSILALIFAVPVFGQSASPVRDRAAQTQPPPSPKATKHDSVEVTARLSAEEAEEGKLNDAYQSIAQEQRQGTCPAEIIERYKSEVIPLSDKSAFTVPKNKFLFLANRDIGNCYLAQQRFVEAEASFEKILQYAPVWPGSDDSAYPINFRQIATAQMGQQRWQAAEESLQKSLSLFGAQIDRAMKSDNEFSRTGQAGNLRGSKAISLAYLGIVYLRERRPVDALTTVDSAFAEANQPDVSSTFVSSVVTIGQSIAQATGDQTAIAKWSKRR